jgi:hypothetical protein
MQPIATFTKIHGKGNIQLVINGIADKELARQRELEHREHEIEMRCMNMWIDTFKKQRDELRQEKRAALHSKHNANIFERTWHNAKETLIFIWSCFICYSEICKLIKYEWWVKEK